MAFVFDIRKTIAAAAHLAHKCGGSIEVLYLMKMLYVADRAALLTWHRPITGDKFYSLPHGPIVSRTYDLIKEAVIGSDMDLWSKAFTSRVGNSITVRDGVDMDWLSDREIEALDAAHKQLHKMKPGTMIDALHKALPEWRDPKGSCELIHPRDIFLFAGVSEEEVDGIMDELNLIQSAKAALASR